MKKRTSSAVAAAPRKAASSQSNAPATQALTIQFSRKLKNGSWVNERIGVAFPSEDGKRLDLKINLIPADLREGKIKIWLTPYEGE